MYRLRQGRRRNRWPCRRSARGQRREVQVCARAATVEAVAAAAELPVRECRWGDVWLAANLVSRACGPHLLYIAQCDRAHQPFRVGRPRSGREIKGPVGRWAH
jgi:hypothetical protein